MTVAILGDVHGCLVELEEMLQLLTQRNVEKYVLVGDLLDKGPDSSGVVRRLREFSKTHEVVLVEGNHENKHSRFRKHLAKGTGSEKKMKNLEELQEITAKLSQEDVDWLDTAVLYYQLSLPAHEIFVCHAGVPPIMKTLPSVEEIASYSNRKRKFYHQLLRVRYVDAHGMMIMLGEEGENDPYWAEVYDGRFGHVYFGHQPFMEDTGKAFPHATGLDLGCVFGGKLCAAFISSDGSDVELVTVDAKAKYAEPKW